jgi:hypothetical protein
VDGRETLEWAKATKSKKKPIDQYDHEGTKRVSNPPVGLVTPEKNQKKRYSSVERLN